MLGVLSIYNFSLTFTAGQEAIASYTHILNDKPLVRRELQ